MATKKPGRPKQERGLRTRENLLKAAIQSMVENHIYGLRFSQIAKIANVPQPLMDYHFPSLEALLTEMVGYQLERLKIASMDAIEKNAASPRKMLSAYIKAPFEMAAADQGFRAVWSAYYHLATVNKSFADFNKGVRQLGNQRITAMVTAVVAHEKRQDAANAKKIAEVATSIQGIITGFGSMASAESDGPFKPLADLAVKAAFQVLEVNFPAPAGDEGRS